MRVRLFSCKKPFEPGTIDQKNIEPAVVVVVVEGNAATRGFEQILVLVLSAKDCFRIQAGVAGNIQKADAQIGVLRPLLFLRICFLINLSDRRPERTGQTEYVLQRQYESRALERL